MNKKTTTVFHTEYFDIVDPIDFDDEWMVNDIYIDYQSTKILFYCQDIVYLKPIYGIVSLLVNHSSDISQLDRFILHGFVKLKPEIFFNCLSVTNYSQYQIITKKASPLKIQYSNQLIYSKLFQEKITIPKIYTFYQQIKKGPYYYPNEVHNYCEMTIIDKGRFHTTIDNKEYCLSDKQLIIYGPNQVHNQSIKGNHSCRYCTIMFEMNPVINELCNKVFTLSYQQFRLIEEILKMTNLDKPFVDELLISKFKELVIRLLVDEERFEAPVRSNRFNYDNTLLNSILAYINENIYQPLMVSDICNEFSISRTYIQELFSKYLMTTPKSYISQVKLQQSKLLIKESKYTISEIGLMLGFSSIHYFSRAFKEEFGISASEYANSIIK